MTLLLFLTIASTILAATMTAIAWRVTREARARSNARVAALAQDINSGFDEFRPGDGAAGPKGPASRLPAGRVLLDPTPPAPATNVGRVLLDPAAEPANGPRWTIAVAAGALMFAIIAAVAVVSMPGSDARTAPPMQPSAPAAAPPPAAAQTPLELVALGHEREGGRLTVRGVIRNPPSAAERDGLTAVVSIFDQDGSFVTSGRAAVASAALVPGGESTFVVSVPAGDVSRYRVSFQSDAGIVSHIDKRTRS